MPAEPKKPLIVISYAHADEPEKPAEGEVKWLSFVTGYLKPAIKHGAVDLWLDRLMPGGANWEPEIDQKLRACDIFILLVSRHSLSSDYVVDKEIPIIRERQAKGEAVHFYPLILTPTPKAGLELVRDKNLRPRDGKPFSDYSPNDRYLHMSDAADEIAAIAVEIAKRKSAETTLSQALSPLQSSAPTTSTIPIAIMGRAGTFVSAPTEPTAIMGRAGSFVSVPAEEPPEQEVQVTDPRSLEAWLKGQTRETAAAIAVRAALRVAPLAARIARKGVGPRQQRELTHVTAAIFRALAAARVSVQDPERIFISSARNAGGAASASSVVAIVAADVARAAMLATRAAANSAAAAAAANPDAAGPAAAAVRSFVEAFVAADLSASDAETAAWNEIRWDVRATQQDGVRTLLEAPLWSHREPRWVRPAIESLQAGLPGDQDWDVWFDWYEQRLGGGSRSEEYELTFASVPQEEWDKGRAAANAWIKAHLPRSGGDLKEGDSLKQQSALYTFRLADGRIAVAPEEAKPEDREGTRDFLDESRRKAAELRERLARAQADARLQRTIALLDERLAPPIGAIRVGLILSSLRSLESDVRAYDTEEGRKEHAPDLIAGLDDLAGTVRDFASQFPRSREIVANQAALALVEGPRALDAAIQASESLAVAAETHPELVDHAAPEALREPKELAEGARTTADRAKQVALRLLTVANFGRIVAQARETAVESWNEVRKQVPRAAGKAAASAVLAGPALALGLWAGHSGLTLLLDAAGAIAAINGAVGHPGGAFDRLLKTIERVAAKKPVAETRDPDPPEVEEKLRRKRKAQKRVAAKPAGTRRKPNRRPGEAERLRRVSHAGRPVPLVGDVRLLGLKSGRRRPAPARGGRARGTGASSSRSSAGR